MSDIEELGGFGSTTPLVPQKRKAPAVNKPKTRNVAGPSSRPAQNKRKNVKPTPVEDSDVEDVESDKNQEDQLEAEEIEEVHDTKASRKPQPRPTTNGKATTKGKGKTKAAAIEIEAMEVDGIDVVNELEDRVADLADAISATGRKTKSSIKDSAVEHVEEKLRQAQMRIENLTKQLDELFLIRETEPEAILRQEEIQFQARIDAQERLIKDLTARLAQQEPLMRSGKSSILHLITREAADEEMRELDQEKNKWKQRAEEAEKKLKIKDGKITEMQEAEDLLQQELKAEIERNKSLNSKIALNPSSAHRGRTGLLGSEDPKHGEVIRFYEDLTNLLVTGAKMSKGKYFNLEEWTFTCIYTYSDKSGKESASLNFTLRTYHDATPGVKEAISKPEQLTSIVHYVPLELDKESPDFVKSLDFLNNTFTFDRNQLSLFLRTLHDNLEALLDGDESTDNVKIV